MIYNDSIKSYIINVKERKNRKIACDKMLKRKRLKSNYHIQSLHPNPIQGNKEAHISLIKKCKEDGLEKVLILEDDFKILGSLDNLPEMPEKWDILYLGGEVLRKLEPIKNGWVRSINKRHHAYIINLKNERMITEIEKCIDKRGKKYCDWMSERIQPQFRTYMLNPMKIVQYDGDSDITKKYEFYGDMVESINDFFVPQHSIKNDLYNLKLPDIKEEDLPNISVITVVDNERDIFSLTLRNFQESFYPKEKIEWIIVETKNTEGRGIKDLIGDVKNLKYILVEESNKFSKEEGIDIGVKNCSNDIVLLMDTMGFYERENMLSRVKLLLKYPNLLGVGTNKIGFYDVIHKKSYLSKYNKQLAISSLCFRKDGNDRKFEDKNFFEGRVDNFIIIPHTFILYGIVFGMDGYENTMGQQLFNYYDTWDIIDQEFMDNLGGYLKKKNKFNEINLMTIN